MKHILAGLILVLATGVHARLSETETACALRYNHGKDVPPHTLDQTSPLVRGPNCTNRTYVFQGWLIRIGFIQGISSRVSYSIHETPRGITPDEVKAILDANGGLSSWRRVRSADFKQTTPVLNRIFSTSTDVWWRNDGSFASMGVTGSTLLLENSIALRQEAESLEPKPRKIPNF